MKISEPDYSPTHKTAAIQSLALILFRRDFPKWSLGFDAMTAADRAEYVRKARDMTDEWKPDDPVLIYKRAMIGARSMRGYKTKPNWVLAVKLFVVGKTYAAEICHYAGIDPEGYEVKW